VTLFGNNGSHNQKIVATPRGIFLTYTYYRGAPDPNLGNQQQVGWALLRSINGGLSFETLYQNYFHYGTNTPSLETHPTGDYLFLVDSDFSGASRSPSPSGTLYDDAFFYRFDATNDYRSPMVMQKIPAASAVKFSTKFDPASNLVYYFTWYRGEDSKELFALDGNGQVVNARHLTLPASSLEHYAYSTSDPWGVVYYAWTTANTSYSAGVNALYPGIHFIVQAGGSFKRADGTILSLPIAPDSFGPSNMVNSPDEIGKNIWLSNMLYKNGKLHFSYVSWKPDGSDYRQRYVRWDLTTGQEDIRTTDAMKGETISILSLHAFFSTSVNVSTSRLTFTGNATKDGVFGLGSIFSEDNGATWHDLAFQPMPPVSSGIYGVTGARELTSDGNVIGTLSLMKSGYVAPDLSDQIFFSFSSR
jgi:hypothetical protein